MRDIKFVEGGFYHVYNRGTDKRLIFMDKFDQDRFFDGLSLYNNEEVIGHLDRRHRVSTGEKVVKPLVNIIAYCLNPNHFHFILEPVVERGIERFMHKLGMGYSKYFNLKYKRAGALFQGKFRAKHIDSNEYLLHLSSYINLNDRVHADGEKISNSKTSWSEYLNKERQPICSSKIILDQFESSEEYKKFAENSLKDIIKRKSQINELELMGIELIETK